MTEGKTISATLLVVDDNPANLDVLLKCLLREGYRVLVAEDGESAIEQAQYSMPGLILLDAIMPGLDGFETCKRLKGNDKTRDIPVVFMTALDDLDNKIRAFKLGAADYITKPFRYEEVLARVDTHLSLRRLQKELQRSNEILEERVEERTQELSRTNRSLQEEVEQRQQAEASLKEALAEVKRLKNRLQAENVYLQEEIREHHGHRIIIGSSPKLSEVLQQVEMVASSNTTVLICGETGTGKELIARAVHDSSQRRNRTMVKLNCAAISAGLVESELFGHLKGAFTGASDKRIGRFQLADGGTLFLDEVSELPLETQAKLLRVLQEQEFEPVGSSETTRVDVRVIAATNRDLASEAKAGRFRSDLFYRLNVFPITLPPLRERRDDLAELAEFFLAGFARKHGKQITRISDETMEKFMRHDWPGNIRDLQNTVERAVILCDGDTLTVGWALSAGPAALSRGDQSAAAPVAQLPDGLDSAVLTLEELERQYITSVLKQTKGVIEGPRGAAKLLNLKPSTARFRIRKLGIRKADYSA